MELRTHWRARHPDFPWLELGAPEAVEALLRRLGWIEPAESFLGCSRAGDGNMNLTLRVSTDRRSVVLKQARPWVEKYDSIPAPWERAEMERRFYERVQSIETVRAAMPRLLAADSDSRTLLLEDLGEDARDLGFLYEEGELDVGSVHELGLYLHHLHLATRGESPGLLVNREMRALNHQHIFVLPFDADNGIDLEQYESGLTRMARGLQRDPALLAEVAALGRRYLADGSCLVHGDFFPGSWLQTPEGLRVIDPEFCHFGDPELDLGVAVAHLALGGQSFDLSRQLLESAATTEPGPCRALVAQYAGVEIARRLLGVAQLPLPPSTGQRAELLDRARTALLEQNLEALGT